MCSIHFLSTFLAPFILLSLIFVSFPMTERATAGPFENLVSEGKFSSNGSAHPFRSEANFVVPNEFNNHLYTQQMGQLDGTLISVGTLRSLFNAVMGNFSHVIMMDYDTSVSEFNSQNIKTIQDLGKSGLSTQQQRQKYLVKLLGCDENNDKLMDLVYRGTDKMSDDESTHYILGAVNEQKCERLNQAMHEALRTLHDKGNDQYSKRMAMIYWANDVAWKKLQNMINQNRITVVNGSLSGDKTMKSIADELKNKKEQVSAIDISNAYDYIQREEGGLKMDCGRGIRQV